jgi:hypothetical protein
MSKSTVEEAHRVAQEELILLPSWEADRVRNYLSAAVERRDAEAIRREGHTWSGRIALSLFELADRLDQAAECDTEQQHARR